MHKCCVIPEAIAGTQGPQRGIICMANARPVGGSSNAGGYNG